MDVNDNDSKDFGFSDCGEVVLPFCLGLPLTLECSGKYDMGKNMTKQGCNEFRQLN